MEVQILDMIKRESKLQTPSRKALSKIEEYMSEYMTKISESLNVELCFRFILLEYNTPICDYELCLEFLSKLLAKNINEIDREKAIILYVYISRNLYGDSIENNLKLDDLINNSSNKGNISMALYLKACSSIYDSKKNIQLELLTKSIELDKSNAKLHFVLARLYVELGLLKDAYIQFDIGKKNISKVILSKEIENEDFTDIERFFDECIRGVVIDEYSYNRLREMYLSI